MTLLGDRSISVINFTVAVSREYTKANGTRDKMFHTFLRSMTAGTYAESFNKETWFPLLGPMRNDKWEKDGVNNSMKELIIFQKLLD